MQDHMETAQALLQQPRDQIRRTKDTLLLNPTVQILVALDA